MITFTCTTSRRLKLFIKMIDSFTRCCLDKDLIERWIIYDDRSSDEDIKIMKRMYPYIEIHRSEKSGQAHSLNNLWKLSDTKWICHVEDDWEFIKQGHFIRECLDIYKNDNRIRNIILRKWNCVYMKSGELEYYGHVHSPQTDPAHMYRSDCNWFGLSFNPGLFHLPTLKKLLPFREDMKAENRDWDKESARQYKEMGFKRANLKDNYIVHTGIKERLYEG